MLELFCVAATVFMVLLVIILVGFAVYFITKRIRNEKAAKLIMEKLPEILNNERRFDKELSSLCESYVTRSAEERFAQAWKPLFDEYLKIYNILRVAKKDAIPEELKSFLSSCSNLYEHIKKSNQEYISKEKSRCKDLLSNIDGKRLDDQQQSVVVSGDDRILVIAGAGSGKTLTIAGKVKYLCEEKGISPEEILLIAFTKKSAEEMTERIAGKLNINVEATTFHKLGLDIIKSAKGYRPDVFESLESFVSDYFENEIVDHPQLEKSLLEYFAYYLNIPTDLEECSCLGEMYDREKSMDLETIQSKYHRATYVEAEVKKRKDSMLALAGEYMKSAEEVMIANFLFLNGVKYEYEKLYPYESDVPLRKAYRPDFYLPDYDLYLEHFGINKENKLPWLSPIEERKYLEGMEWKRAFHEQNGTKLIETYSYYASEGVLVDRLDFLLQENGVIYKERDIKEIFESVYSKESDKYFSEFIKLCCTFITLFKSNGYKISDLRSLSHKSKKYNVPFFKRRTKLFQEIVESVMFAYEIFLEENRSVDFSDMINAATEIVKSGHLVKQYKYVIIDEYQDISVARFNLVKAILNQTRAKLMCVGDDWQSIYRFAGSDISLFTDFEMHFGRAQIMRLEKTYRNAQQLIDEAGKFVMQNPSQFKKNLRSAKSLDYPIVMWLYSDNPFIALEKAIRKIISEFGSEKSILILGRTSYDIEMLRESGMFDINGEKIRFLASPTTPIQFLSVHKSKGLESDNVVLLNFRNATLGFPNKIADDPMLELVLSSSDTYWYAEERRLLYVALTRTKNRVYIMVDENAPSEFFSEFTSSNRVFITRSTIGNNPEEKLSCPRCMTGRLIIRKNESANKYFIGCSNYPKCDYANPYTSVMTYKKVCVGCGGYMAKKSGKFGAFWGCTNYPICSHTEQIDTPK